MNAHLRGFVKAAMSHGFNEQAATQLYHEKVAFLPAWGGQTYHTKRLGPIRGNAGYDYLFGAVPFPHVGVGIGGDDHQFTMSGPLPGIGYSSGLPKDFSGVVRNYPRSIWAGLFDKEQQPDKKKEK